MHLSSENGSSVSSKSDPPVDDLGGGGIRVSRVRRCLWDGGGEGGLRWVGGVGVNLRGREMGPVVVEIFLEDTDEYPQGRSKSNFLSGRAIVTDCKRGYMQRLLKIRTMNVHAIVACDTGLGLDYVGRKFG